MCIASPDARTDVREDCPIGDYPNVIDNLGKTCTETVRDSPDQCYSTYISKLCCDSCPSVNTGVTGEYRFMFGSYHLYICLVIYIIIGAL